MTVLVHLGELVTGRIVDTIPVTSLRWSDVLNGSGSIDVTVSEDVVRDHELRQKTHGVRCFLAVERDGRLKQAGPIWKRRWDRGEGKLTLAAEGLWSYFDYRLIHPLPFTYPYAKMVFSVTGKSLGGLARALAANAIDAPFGYVPIVLPADEAGTHEETFPFYSLLDYGEQWRQITQRATDAPDIRFLPRRKASDPRFIEWVMQVGTEAQPALQQGGPDWVFDASAPRSPVRGISTDEDATVMAESVWVTGEGQEESTPIATAADQTLLELPSPWPLTHAKDLHSNVSDEATLQGHADGLLQRRNRPIEVYKVRVDADQAHEVMPGDYARTITRGDIWLGDMDITTRIRQISGDLSDELTLDMFAVQVAL